MRRLRGRGLGALGLAAAAVAGAALAVLVPTAEEGPAQTVHAQLGGSVEPVGGAEPGMIVVADNRNGRIQVFYPDGTFAFKFSGQADSIDVGPDGTIVTMKRSYGHYVYHPNGTFASHLGGGVGGIGRSPMAAVAPDGRIVVVDHTRPSSLFYSRAQVFGPDGAFESVFDIGAGGKYLSDVDISPDGLIVVADNNAYSNSDILRNGSWKGIAPGHIRAFHFNGTPAFSFPVVSGDPNVRPTLAHVAVGPDGEIVTVEGAPDPHALRVYRPNGTHAYEFAHGFVRETYGYMTGVAVGPNGRIMVGDGGNNTVSVYHPNGSLALVFGGHGVVQTGFNRPTDAAVGPNGRIVVAEPGKRTVSVFHPNGTLAFAFGSYGHGDGAFYRPELVAVGPDGRIVVGDTEKRRILVFDPDGTPVLAFGLPGHGAGKFAAAMSDVAVAPNGSIVVVEGNDRDRRGSVQVFGPDGSFVSELGSGDRSESWSIPIKAAVGPDGRIVVVHTNSYYGLDPAVHVFEPDGTVAFAISLVREDYDPIVAVGPDGRIMVVQGSRSQVFNPDGTFAFATEIDADAVSVAVGPSREIVMVDDRDDRVQVFTPTGTFAFSLLPDLSEGKFRSVGSIAIGPVMPPPRGDPKPLWTSIEAEEGGVGGAPILRNFTNVGDAANVTIDVSGLAGPGGVDALNGSESSTVTFPTSETTVAASFAEVTFPPNVTASHVPAGGRLALRVATDVPAAEQVQVALGRNGSGGPEVIVLLQGVVEVGVEAGPRIMFDLPVRISLEGQAGGRAFYIEGDNGTIVPIDGACAADDVDRVHEHLGGARECQMDSADGTAKIVYTYHLTKFGTVSIEGPVPARTDAIDPPATPPPVVVVPPIVTGNGTFVGGDGGGGGNATNGTAGPPTPPPQQPGGGPAVDTCAISISSPALDMSARPGEYSEPVEQDVINSGTLRLAHVEIEATPWHDGSGPPTPPPLPGVPPPYSGPTEGRTAGAFTAYMIASLPASVTEVNDGPRAVNGQIVAGVYEPLADDGRGTAVLEGLPPGGWALLSFRLNLTPYDGLLAGALVQSITYQAECIPLSAGSGGGGS